MISKYPVIMIFWYGLKQSGNIIVWSIISTLWVSCDYRLPSTDKENSRPNIVLILADDLGYGDVGFHGNKIVQTPNLDQLAGKSIEFTHFYTAPVCSPTRAGLLTGNYSQRSGVWATHSGGEIMRSSAITLAEYLKDQEYSTGIFGKWHLGEAYPWVPTQQGFQEGVYGRTSGLGYFNTTLEQDLQPYPTEGYLTDRLTDAALEFITANQKNPFFAYIPFFSIHKPHQAKETYRSHYLSEGVDTSIAEVYGMASSLDENVGRILAHLQKLTLMENTIVLFLSDNGIDQPKSRYNAGLKEGKPTVYEGCVRVPLLIRWDGHFAAGKKRHAVVSHLDILPTILELTGISEPATPLDGQSFLPLVVNGDQDAERRKLFFHFHNSSQPDPHHEFGVLNFPHKMVRGLELYNLEEDPEEQSNIADKYPEVVEELMGDYDIWWKDITDNEYVGNMPVLPLGHPQENPSVIKSWYARPTGNIHYKSAYGGDGDAHIAWMQGWENMADSLTWDVEVLQKGRYDVSMVYSISKENAGAQISVRSQRSSITTKVMWKSPEMYGGSWMKADIGSLELDPGRAELIIKAVDIPGNEVIKLERLIITKRKAERN